MADDTTSYFWQGGRKIPIRKDAATITIQASSESAALEAAGRAGVQVDALHSATPALVRLTLPRAETETSVNRLRAQREVVHHVYRAAPQGSTQPESEPADEGGDEYLITESFFLKFKPGTAPQRIQDHLRGQHLVVERELGDLTFLVRVTDATGKNPIRAANEAQASDVVEYAEPNLVRPLTRFFIPSDPLFASQWHLHAPSAGTDLVAGAGIFAAEAWDLTRGRRDVVIAVADDGFDMTHPDFQGEGKVVARLNATLRGEGADAPSIEWDADVQPRAGDYHGTPCLGVAAAEGNGGGVIGVAPGCGIVALRFPLAAMTDANFIAMFRKLSPLADVVSCSWGVGPANAPMSRALADAITALAQSGGRRGKGMVFCIAAGNNNCPVQDLQNTRRYEYLDRFGIRRGYAGPIDRWVAAHPAALIVSASTSLKTRSAYSSWGRQISVCAPSDNWDDLRAQQVPGRGIVTTDNEGAGPRSDFTPNSRFTDRFGGTSSATPTVAGVCALVLSANPALSAQQVREIICKSADKDLSLQTHTPVNEPGGFDAQGFSLWFGHGKVNAFKAVKAATAGTLEQRTIDRSLAPGLAIPDAGAPIVSALEIGDEGRIEDLRIQVEIAHSYVGDLRVDLLAPDGTAVALHNHGGGSADDLRRTYSVANHPALRGLLGRAITGRWQLRVADSVRLDAGRLERWRLFARVSIA
ncbi:S8 family serine peptidase [Roseateles sp. DAIF2]|uniref:S8 family serine peptidase n=1 Tax=Roseateles sp. DAIF2 TaxID=2714952 RepID=UPI0018A2AD98|nr:S8 family serine peptidase [Roseateles sp. DAIF2]QPF73000.1 S8 family serine peptidase [Roseateles sp. DAIF2]